MNHAIGQASDSILTARTDISPFQEKISVRQAKRAAKAEERREKSESLKQEGNTFFRNGNFEAALERYQQAIDVHTSVKPVLLTNLAAVYLKLCMYAEAHEAADRALAGDPTSVKARYRRGMARKHLKMWSAADIDFRTLLALDPGNKDVEAELAFIEEKRCDPSYWEEEEDVDNYSDFEAPALGDDPELGESLSESSDCEHTGNGIPCKFYNRTECKNGHACRFSHAPDDKSERDALGRNVCSYYLIGVCKFGERCSYLHSKGYLFQPGWWSTTDGVENARWLYNLFHERDNAITGNNGAKAPKTGQTSKKRTKGKKKKHVLRSRATLRDSESGVSTSKSKSFREPPASGIRHRAGPKTTKNGLSYSYSRWAGYDSDEEYGGGMCGFTESDVEELLCQGVKPWDDDAWDVLNVLRGL